jgi:uncharacterized protein (TIGR03085 family)
MTPDLDQRERSELCDRFDALGPDAPTLCAGWTTADLAAHLVVRERHPTAMPGVLFERFAGPTKRAMAGELERHGYAGVVQRVRSGPPPGPLRIPPVRYVANLIEFTIHHEDVRRANGDGPRTDRVDLDDAVWRLLRRAAPLMVAKARPEDVTLEACRGDGDVISAGRGRRTVVVAGEPVEVLLYLYGRTGAAQVLLDGDPEAVAAVNRASFGI